jgi:hypothetical protein
MITLDNASITYEAVACVLIETLKNTSANPEARKLAEEGIILLARLCDQVKEITHKTINESTIHT